MDYLQEDYYPPSTSNTTTAVPPSQIDPPPNPTTPAQATQHDISYAPPDSTPSAHPNNPHDSTDPYNGMPPPPSSTYPTLEALMTACQTHARTHGYACVTSSNNHKRGIAYVRCDRGGQYANHWNLTPETRTRHNRTRRLVGCTWKARAKRLKSGEWELRMMEDKHSGHGRSGDAKAHPSLRKLDGGAVEEAKRLFGLGRGPKEVLDVLRGWNASVTAQDIYNLKAKIAREREGGGKARVRKAAAADAGAVGASAAAATALLNNGDVAVDPALQQQQNNRVTSGIGGIAPAARMQDIEMRDEMGMNGVAATAAAAAAASASAATNGPAPTERNKCECKCCEH